jgi:hypothetical protein
MYRKLPAGSYRVKVSGVGGASGPYALRFQILSNSLSFVTRTGWQTGSTVVFAGEIVNGYSSIRRSIVVHATLYNASNQTIGERSAYAYTYGLVSGRTAPYRLAFTAPAGYDHAVMSITSTSTSTAPVGGLTVLMGTRFTDGSGYHVPGTVRNTNAFTVDTTRVAVALYDSRASVMNAVRVSPSSTTLGAGKSASYDAVFADHFTSPELISRRAMASR